MKSQETVLHWERHGTGKNVVLLFHGFGQNHTAFKPWLPYFSSQYSVYTFDLFYHGQSSRADISLNKQEWKQILNDFFIDQEIDHFQLAAFSLGGRFALITAFLFTDRVDFLILLAPDGIYRSIWYKTATNVAGNRLFKSFMLHPNRFNSLLKLAKKLHLSSSSTIRFAQKELTYSENRMRVYQSWTYFHDLQCPLSRLKKQLNCHTVPVKLILGTQDFIIPKEKIVPKMKDLTHLEVKILDCKHHQLIEASKGLVPSLF